MTAESHREFGIFAAIARAHLAGPAASAPSGLIPVVAAAARGLDRAGDELLDRAIAVPTVAGPSRSNLRPDRVDCQRV